MFSTMFLVAATMATAPLNPTSKWVISSEADRCVLARSYGEGDDALTLLLRPAPSANTTEIALMVPKNLPDVTDGDAELGLLPSLQSTKLHYSRYSRSGSSGSIYKMQLDNGALPELEKSSAATLRFRKEAYSFSLPQISGALLALASCRANLLQTWGIDRAEQARAVTPPRLVKLKNFDDEYPSSALRAREDGPVVAVASLNSDGIVQSCTIAVKNRSVALNDATCDVLMRGIAIFSPALDKDGKAIPAHVVVPWRWELPQ